MYEWVIAKSSFKGVCIHLCVNDHVYIGMKDAIGNIQVYVSGFVSSEINYESEYIQMCVCV